MTFSMYEDVAGNNPYGTLQEFFFFAPVHRPRIRGDARCCDTTGKTFLSGTLEGAGHEYFSVFFIIIVVVVVGFKTILEPA